MYFVDVYGLIRADGRRSLPQLPVHGKT